MKVYIAEPCGFCFGARRSMELASQPNKAYSLGHILHNEILIEKLKEKGIEPLCFEKIVKKELSEIKKVIIRTHGVPIKQIKKLKQKGFEIIDGTCPKVKDIYDITAKYEQKGYQIIIFGDKNHPEVIGVMSRLENPFVVKKAEDIKGEHEKICLVSQTTQRKDIYDKLKIDISKKCTELKAFDTICSATQERQKAASAIAEKADVMLVIGGKQSSNTNRLYEICKQANNKTYLIQSEENLEKKWFSDAEKIGITAGASTPDFVIDSVVKEFKKY